jgi:adenine specific DNA methylase Mod
VTLRKLYFGDNLEILREQVADESVDLVYLDPPFNSNQSYNVLFKERDTRPSQAQIEAFDDTWHWTPETQHEFELLMTSPDVPRELAKGLDAFRIMLGENDVMAYLVMMAPRLLELHRVLKPTGSLYLHCDPTASHYLKVICDQVFDARNFRNEVIWKRTGTVKGNFGQGSKSSAHLRTASCSIQSQMTTRSTRNSSRTPLNTSRPPIATLSPKQGADID